MKTKIVETVEIPAGIECSMHGTKLTCKNGSNSIERDIGIPRVSVKLDSSKITFECPKGNKNDLKSIRSNMAHIRNMFQGITEKFVYQLQSCNVHFPMTLKVEGSKLAINNFLGEKTPRFAVILPHVAVEVKGQNITVSSSNREAAGDTAANIERATKVRNRDRRIFQDGIYIVERPGRNV